VRSLQVAQPSTKLCKGPRCRSGIVQRISGSSELRAHSKLPTPLTPAGHGTLNVVLHAIKSFDVSRSGNLSPLLGIRLGNKIAHHGHGHGHGHGCGPAGHSISGARFGVRMADDRERSNDTSSRYHTPLDSIGGMCEMGQRRISAVVRGMSAYTSKADLSRPPRHVSFLPHAEVTEFHSISSSAMVRRVDGTSRPRALAVFTLTSSCLLNACTGSSPA
jgi:hypothetical protein